MARTSPTGMVPMTSRTPGGRSIHGSTRTQGEQGHLTEFILTGVLHTAKLLGTQICSLPQARVRGGSIPFLHFITAPRPQDLFLGLELKIHLAMNASEAGGDLVLIETSLLFSCKFKLDNLVLSTELTM